MASFCVRPNGILQYDLCFYGRRFRESAGLPDTPENRRKVRKNLRRINAEWEMGTFDYAAWFPRSRKREAAQRWLRERGSRVPGRRFAAYADEWYGLHAGGWKASYARQVRSAIDRYLIPHFGDWPLDAINERAVRAFRQALIDAVDQEGQRRLSNARINFILTPLSGILRFAERELGITHPMTELQPLRDDPHDPMPLTAEEVNAFLATVDPRYRLYFKLRFYTGLRSCEVNGLKVGYLDLERRQLRVREALVDGRQTTLKHRKARRDVPLSPGLAGELRAHVAGKVSDAYVFCRADGRPLAASWVAETLWAPTLDALGLERRRVYQTRHTAAVLHLAAGENPLFVSRLLGHSSTKMLFERYAPFVANALADDGSRFERMMNGGPDGSGSGEQTAGVGNSMVFETAAQ
ncbi:MAG: Arm DNA-binding domain-containing protein [Halochromatium sp.]|uniref:Arm DNA-binding domain-containing protein n=1 Tax=Halochromatium sp. TaxID=2049430 RepID=UPI00397B9D77